VQSVRSGTEPVYEKQTCEKTTEADGCMTAARGERGRIRIG
jgi:hypothetical protein